MCPTENPALQLFIFSGRWIYPKSINTAVPESYLKVLILIKDLGQILHNKCSLPPSSKSLQKHHVSTFKAEISSHSSPGAPLYISFLQRNKGFVPMPIFSVLVSQIPCVTYFLSPLRHTWLIRPSSDLHKDKHTVSSSNV